MKDLDWLLSSSKAGAIIQSLLVVAAPKGSAGPLGIPDESKVERFVYAISPDGDSHREIMAWVRRAILTVAIEHEVAGRDVLFAGLAHEFWTVSGHIGDTDRQAEVLRYQSEGRLYEHPDAVEATMVYAACKDGRRWGGLRYLTGPDAGKKLGVDMFVGRVAAHEGMNLSTSPLVRRLVGLDF